MKSDKVKLAYRSLKGMNRSLEQTRHFSPSCSGTSISKNIWQFLHLYEGILMKKKLYCVLGNGEMEKGETPQTSECQRHLKLQKRHLKYIETPSEKKDPRLG
jgi:hypothetical protein